MSPKTGAKNRNGSRGTAMEDFGSLVFHAFPRDRVKASSPWLGLWDPFQMAVS